jgi:hypothetical protein
VDFSGILRKCDKKGKEGSPLSSCPWLNRQQQAWKLVWQRLVAAWKQEIAAKGKSFPMKGEIWLWQKLFPLGAFSLYPSSPV